MQFFSNGLKTWIIGSNRCGFAQGQDAYGEALEELFSTLDMLEGHLGCSRYLCGDDVTLADIRLFTTLYRFDPVYHILFKCSKRKISEYPNLYGYLKDMYQVCLGLNLFFHILFILCKYRK